MPPRDLIRDFAIEAAERGADAVAAVKAVSFALLTAETPHGVIAEGFIVRVMAYVAGTETAELAERLVAVCRDASGGLSADDLRYCREWLDRFDGFTPLPALVRTGLITELPTRPPRRKP
jgi:hypothetical protein